MSDFDDVMEKGDKPEMPEQPSPTVVEESKRKRRFVIAMIVFVVIALIIGLSVGLTQRGGSSEPAQNLGESPTVATTDAPAPAGTAPPTEAPVMATEAPTGAPTVEGLTGTPTIVSVTEAPTLGEPSTPTEDTSEIGLGESFQSNGKAFDVRMNLFNPDILEGYDNNVTALREDLDQAIRFYINAFIEGQIQSYDPFFAGPVFVDEVAETDTATGSVPAPTPSAEGTTDYETNNQEEGVDEADLVKSDGTYVYAAYGDTLVVWEALTGDLISNISLPAVQQPVDTTAGEEEPLGRSSILYEEPKADIRGMSLEDGRLVLFVDGYGPEVREEKNANFSCYDAFATRVIVYSTEGLPGSLDLVTQKDVLGSYSDARAIGSDIHVVTKCGIDYSILTNDLYRWDTRYEDMNETEYRATAAAIVEPRIGPFVDNLVSDITEHGPPNLPRISLWLSELGNNTDVVENVFKDGSIQSYTSLISFSVSNLNGDLQLSTSGAFTPSSWGFTYALNGTLVFAAQGWDWIPEVNGTGQTTYLVGFSLSGTTSAPAFIGSLPGYIQNQYALSIFEGHLRVATTIDAFWPIWIAVEPDIAIDEFDVVEPMIWPRPEPIIKNQVIILKIPTTSGENLEEVARIPDLGEEGERITAIRYFGPIGYTVTFRQTDPFYVLQLDPQDAKELGELKVTGFASYLHSINSNNSLLVGVGQEADEDGRILGLQVSLVDATNQSDPQLLHRRSVEEDTDAWSSSDVSFDFKAFRWLPLGVEVGLVIIPVRIESWSQSDVGNYDGFYVFDVSRDGIEFRLNISHVDSADFYGCYSQSQLPQRSLVFNGNVTTLKGHSVLSTDLDSGERRWRLELPKPSDPMYCYYW